MFLRSRAFVGLAAFFALISIWPPWYHGCKLGESATEDVCFTAGPLHIFSTNVVKKLLLILAPTGAATAATILLLPLRLYELNVVGRTLGAAYLVSATYASYLHFTATKGWVEQAHPDARFENPHAGFYLAIIVNIMLGLAGVFGVLFGRGAMLGPTEQQLRVAEEDFLDLQDATPDDPIPAAEPLPTFRDGYSTARTTTSGAHTSRSGSSTARTTPRNASQMNETNPRLFKREMRQELDPTRKSRRARAPQHPLTDREGRAKMLQEMQSFLSPRSASAATASWVHSALSSARSTISDTFSPRALATGRGSKDARSKQKGSSQPPGAPLLSPIEEEGARDTPGPEEGGRYATAGGRPPPAQAPPPAAAGRGGPGERPSSARRLFGALAAAPAALAGSLIGRGPKEAAFPEGGEDQRYHLARESALQQLELQIFSDGGGGGDPAALPPSVAKHLVLGPDGGGDGDPAALPPSVAKHLVLGPPPTGGDGDGDAGLKPAPGRPGAQPGPTRGQHLREVARRQREAEQSARHAEEVDQAQRSLMDSIAGASRLAEQAGGAGAQRAALERAAAEAEEAAAAGGRGGPPQARGVVPRGSEGKDAALSAKRQQVGEQRLQQDMRRAVAAVEEAEAREARAATERPRFASRQEALAAYEAQEASHAAELSRVKEEVLARQEAEMAEELERAQRQILEGAAAMAEGSPDRARAVAELGREVDGVVAGGRERRGAAEGGGIPTRGARGRDAAVAAKRQQVGEQRLQQDMRRAVAAVEEAEKRAPPAQGTATLRAQEARHERELSAQARQLRGELRELLSVVSDAHAPPELQAALRADLASLYGGPGGAPPPVRRGGRERAVDRARERVAEQAKERAVAMVDRVDEARARETAKVGMRHEVARVRAVEQAARHDQERARIAQGVVAQLAPLVRAMASDPRTPPERLRRMREELDEVQRIAQGKAEEG